MICSSIPRAKGGYCHGRSFSTNTMPASVAKTFESDDDSEARVRARSCSVGSYAHMMYHRSTDTSGSSRQSPSAPTTPKSSTSRSLTGFHVRRRYQNQDRHDSAGRRRSANADILENLGLPSMVSFEYMKSLEDGITEDDIRKPRKSKKSRHQRSSSRRVSVCLAAYNDCFRGAASVVSDGAAQLAKRVSRWTRKVSPSSAPHQGHQGHPKEQSPDRDAPSSCQSAADEHSSDAGLPDSKQAHAFSPRPSMWIRHRKVSSTAPSTAPVDEKSI